LKESNGCTPFGHNQGSFLGKHILQQWLKIRVLHINRKGFSVFRDCKVVKKKKRKQFSILQKKSSSSYSKKARERKSSIQIKKSNKDEF
jgi:hypothetical protein